MEPVTDGLARGINGRPSDTVPPDPTRYAIDPSFNPAHEFASDAPLFYWNDNGMIEGYGDTDLTTVGVPSFGPPPTNASLAYTAAQVNAIVGGVKAFFTARAAMIAHPFAMAALIGDRTVGRRRWDPEALPAIRESAKGAT
jgi:hypothetical protein